VCELEYSLLVGDHGDRKAIFLSIWPLGRTSDLKDVESTLKTTKEKIRRLVKQNRFPECYVNDVEGNTITFRVDNLNSAEARAYQVQMELACKELKLIPAHPPQADEYEPPKEPSPPLYAKVKVNTPMEITGQNPSFNLHIPIEVRVIIIIPMKEKRRLRGSIKR